MPHSAFAFCMAALTSFTVRYCTEQIHTLSTCQAKASGACEVETQGPSVEACAGPGDVVLQFREPIACDLFAS